MQRDKRKNRSIKMKKNLQKKNIKYKKLIILTTITLILSFLIGFAEASSISQIDCNLLNIYNILNSSIFIIGLVLMLLGGTLYAAANIMPGTTRGSLQGYGMGMILGGVIGVIIAELAPYIFSIITGNTINAYANGCPLGSTSPGGGGSGGSPGGGGGGGGGCPFRSISACKKACVGGRCKPEGSCFTCID